MAKEHPYILFVGSEQRGQLVQAEAERLDWPVHITNETMDALAAYIFFYPDVVVLDVGSDPATVREVLWHLNSIGAGPLVILLDEAQRQDWDIPASPSVRLISPMLGGTAWAAAVQDLLGQAAVCREPNLDSLDRTAGPSRCDPDSVRITPTDGGPAGATENDNHPG